MKQWFVAKTKPQKERFLSKHLASMRVRTFCPEIPRVAGNGPRTELLFPTYIFCRVDPADPSWPRIRWSSGLAYLLSADGQASPVPDSLIDFLRERTDLANAQAPARLEAGERVAVNAGPFKGLEGIFRRYASAEERCLVLLETLGGLLSVELPGNQLRSANRQTLLRV